MRTPAGSGGQKLRSRRTHSPLFHFDLGGNRRDTFRGRWEQPGPRPRQTEIGGPHLAQPQGGACPGGPPGVTASGRDRTRSDPTAERDTHSKAAAITSKRCPRN
eukprot:2603369-Pyramimonas_sp.AAC.1